MKEYVSEKLLTLLKQKGVDSKLYDLVNSLNEAYMENDFEKCHVLLRKITEYTCGIFKVEHLQDIIESGFWDKSTHTDHNHYCTQLTDLDENIANFNSLEDEQKKKELRLIESQRLYANNYLHETPNKHTIILDEYSLPPINQVHLLLTLCIKGIEIRKKKEHEHQNTLSWDRGIEFFDEKFESNSEENIYLDFFHDLSSGTEKILYANESTKIAAFMIKADYKGLSAYVRLTLKEIEPEKNLNRWAQLTSISAFCEIKSNNRENAISLYKKLYNKTFNTHPHLAENAARILKILFFRESAERAIWESKRSALGEVNQPVLISDDMSNILFKMYEEVAKIRSGMISSGSPLLPVLSTTIISSIKYIINCCSYGLVENIPAHMNFLLKMSIIQDSLSNINRNTNLFYTLKWLELSFGHDEIQETELDVILKAYSASIGQKSLFEIAFNSFKGTPHVAVIKLLIETIDFGSQEDQSKLKKKVWKLYSSKKSKKDYSPICYRAYLFKLWLKILVKNKKELFKESKSLLSAIPEAIQQTYAREFWEELRELCAILDQVFTDDDLTKMHKCIYHIVENYKENKDEKIFLATCYLIAGGDITKLKDKFSPFILWQICPSKKQKMLFPNRELILEEFSNEVDRVAIQKGYSSNDDIINNFHGLSCAILKYCEGSIDLSDRAINCVVKLVKTMPTEHSILVGANIDSFYHKLCLLIDSDITQQHKEKLFLAVKDTIKITKKNEIYHKETKVHSEGVYNFYFTILNAFIYNKKIPLNEVYKVLFNLKLFSSFSYVPTAFYFMYKNTTSQARNFMVSYLLDVIKSFSADSITSYKLTHVFKILYKESPYAKKVFKENIYSLPIPAIEIIDRSYLN